MTETHIVHKIEHHVLKTCPCSACEAERKRREPPANPHILRLKPSVAYLFGFIPRRHPQGSLARELMGK